MCEFVHCDTPQGSVIGPLLFLLYVADVLDLIIECGLAVHAYADDIQAHMSVPAVHQSTAMQRLASCIIRIRDWMASNRLKLNEEKTQVIWLGTRQQLAKTTIDTLTLPHMTIQCSLTVRNLAVTLDGQLSMADHVAAMSRSCFHQHRQLRAVRKSLTLEALQTLVQSFISNQLDYCNGTLVRIKD